MYKFIYKTMGLDCIKGEPIIALVSDVSLPCSGREEDRKNRCIRGNIKL